MSFFMMGSIMDDGWRSGLSVSSSLSVCLFVGSLIVCLTFAFLCGVI